MIENNNSFVDKTKRYIRYAKQMIAVPKLQKAKHQCYI